MDRTKFSSQWIFPWIVILALSLGLYQTDAITVLHPRNAFVGQILIPETVDNPNYDNSRKNLNLDSINTLNDSARYAIHYFPSQESPPRYPFLDGLTSGNSSITPDDKLTPVGAVANMVNHIANPFLHGLVSALLATLYIVALISLITFATAGTVAFICSFADCRHFFMGNKTEGPSSKSFNYDWSSMLFRKRDEDHGLYRWKDPTEPPSVVYALMGEYKDIVKYPSFFETSN